jgi:hypothetical protein
VYRDQFERTWNDETTVAAGRAQKKWRSRSKKQGDDLTGDSSNSDATSISPSSSSFEDVVLERFFFDWVIPPIPANSPVTFFAFLPLMYRNTKPGSVLAESVSALAFANYGQRMKNPEATAHAVQSYGNALGLLARAIGGAAGSKADETLLSVVLLGMYEVSGGPCTRKIRC